MKCPDCAAEVDPAQDFCLECGEPIAGMKGAPAAAAAPAATPAATVTPATAQPPAPARPRPRRQEEPEPIRCPGCGAPSRKARCPGCGSRLRPDED